MASLAFMVLITLIGATASLFLKRGSSSIRKNLKSFIFNNNIIIGIILYLCSTAMYIALLKQVELSILYPLTSLSYIWVMILSRIYLHEAITKNKMVSTGLIISGIIILTSF